MDFITGIPSSEGEDCIFLLVDYRTKYAHFFMISSRIFASQIAEIFFQGVLCLHGFPKTIVSDRDNRFMEVFLQDLFRLVGTKLTPSTGYHP